MRDQLQVKTNPKRSTSWSRSWVLILEPMLHDSVKVQLFSVHHPKLEVIPRSPRRWIQNLTHYVYVRGWNFDQKFFISMCQHISVWTVLVLANSRLISSNPLRPNMFSLWLHSSLSTVNIPYVLALTITWTAFLWIWMKWRPQWCHLVNDCWSSSTENLLFFFFFFLLQEWTHRRLPNTDLLAITRSMSVHTSENPKHSLTCQMNSWCSDAYKKEAPLPAWR